MIRNIADGLCNVFYWRLSYKVLFRAEGGLSLDLRSADKELKAVTPEK